jgi:hypothetical protein
MPEPINPYESPAARESMSIAAPPVVLVKAMRRLVLGLGILRAAAFVSVASVAGLYGTIGLSMLVGAAGAALRVYSLAIVMQDVAAALGLLGALFCFAIPADRKARGWIQACAVIGTLAVLVRGAEYFSNVGIGTYYLRLLLGNAAGGAKLMFLFRLCRWLDRDEFVERSATLLKLFGLGLALIVLCFGFLFLVRYFGIDTHTFAFFLARVPADIVFLVLAVKFITLVGDIRVGIRSRGDPAENDLERNDVA